MSEPSTRETTNLASVLPTASAESFQWPLGDIESALLDIEGLVELLVDKI